MNDDHGIRTMADLAERAEREEMCDEYQAQDYDSVVDERFEGFTVIKRYDGLSIRVHTPGLASFAILPLTKKNALTLANIILSFYKEEQGLQAAE